MTRARPGQSSAMVFQKANARQSRPCREDKVETPECGRRPGKGVHPETGPSGGNCAAADPPVQGSTGLRYARLYGLAKRSGVDRQQTAVLIAAPVHRGRSLAPRDCLILSKVGVRSLLRQYQFQQPGLLPRPDSRQRPAARTALGRFRAARTSVASRRQVSRERSLCPAASSGSPDAAHSARAGSSPEYAWRLFRSSRDCGRRKQPSMRGAALLRPRSPP